MHPEHTRLNKFIATHAGLSRREADELIERGRVTVNGQPAALGGRVAPSDTIAIDGEPVTTRAELTYLALHKPVGYVCSRKKQGSTDTIYSLLPKQYHALKPVGRLDKDSSGLILLTNDGDFAHRMTHPGFGKTKIYHVALDHPLQPLHQQMISDFGVMLEDGKSQFLVEKIHDEDKRATSVTATTKTSAQARVSLAAGSWSGEDVVADPTEGSPADTQEAADDETRRAEAVLAVDGGGESLASTSDDGSGVSETIYQITMREGRNRQIRRTFAALGYTVTRLHRTHFGPYNLGGLPSGHYEPVLPR